MARSKKSVSKDPSYTERKPLEYYPVERSIDISPNTLGGPHSTKAIVDSSALLSKANHRLYRYGKKYNMKLNFDIGAFFPGANRTYEIYALSDTWMVQKAYEEAKEVFDKAYQNERENLSKKSVARWFDFRINPGLAGDNMDPVTTIEPGTTGTFVATGEVLPSIVEDSNGVQRTFSWDPTTTVGNYSVIAEYSLAGNTTVSPTTPTGSGPYADLEADSSVIEMEALQDRGNVPPYDPNTLPSVWKRVATIGMTQDAAQGTAQLTTGFFDAPCGVVVIVCGGGTTTLDLVGHVRVEYRAGDYKGVRAHNMHRELKE